MSLMIFSVFSFLTGVTEFNAIEAQILQPTYLLVILSLSIIFGIVPGLLIKLFFRRNIVRGDTWQVIMNSASKEGAWVLVYTVDGKEYKGSLHYSGGKNFAKELSIRNPTQIYRNKEGSLEDEVTTGTEILFAEKDVLRIVFFKKV